MKKSLVAFTLLGLTLAGGAFAGPVNVNTADAKTIAKELKGVGMAKAEAIVKYRKAHGPFQSLAELEQVKGIGEATIAKNKGDIQLDAPHQSKQQ